MPGWQTLLSHLRHYCIRQYSPLPHLFSAPIVVLSLVMITNGLTNFLIFKFHSLHMFYWVLFQFTLLFVKLMLSLYQANIFSVGIAGIYLLWLCYDIYSFRMLWNLNTNSITNNQTKSQQIITKTLLARNETK